MAISMPFVTGQEVYTQTVYPSSSFDWSRHTIYMSIPSSPSWAHDVVNSSLKVWNDAQDWFLETYYPNMTYAKFTLIEAPSAQVTVTFVQTSQTGTCGSVPAGGWVGCTWLRGDHAQIKITLDRYAANLTMGLLETANHEVGHVLGLDDTPNGYDLMQLNGGAYSYPSTLDLFAVFVVAKGTRFYDYAEIALPKGIPYIQWLPGNSTSVPEFQNMLPILIAVMLSFAYLRPKRR